MDWVLDFLDPDPSCLQQDQERGFLCCSRSGFDVDFLFAEKTLLVGCFTKFIRSQTVDALLVSRW